MKALTWMELRFSAGEELGDPAAGVVAGRDRLAPAGRDRVILKEATEPAARAAMATEVEELLGLVHPCLRRLVACGGGDQRQVAALERVDGEPLDGHLARAAGDGPWCAESLLRALVYLHGQGRAHGDLKPDNVLVGGGALRLIDLGLACKLGAPCRGGTRGFLAPEQLRGAAASVAGDLYAFGATFRAAGVLSDERLEALVAACLAEEPDRRPASADSALGMLGSVPRPVDRAGQMPRQGSRAPLEAITGLLERVDGGTVVVEGPPLSGRTRLLRDALRPALLRGQPLAEASCAEGHDPLGALGRVLLGAKLPEDPERAAALTAAAAGRGGIPVVLDDVDQGDEGLERLLPIAAASLAELGCGALVVVGADEELARRLHGAGAQRHRIEPVDVTQVRRMLEAASARLGDAVASELVAASGGRAGLCAAAALVLSESPGASAGEAASLVVRGRGGAEAAPTASSPAEALRRGREALEEGAFGRAAGLLEVAGSGSGIERREAAVLLARAEAGRGRLARAVAVVEALGDAAPEGARLAAGRWLERLGRYEAVEPMVEPLLESGDRADRHAAVAVVSQAAYGLGEPERADRLAAEALAGEDRSLSSGLACRLLCVRSDAALMRGAPDEAVEHAIEAQRVARAQVDPTLLPQAIAREAAGHALGGRPVTARDRHRAAYDAALAAGDVAGLPPYELNLATAEHALGELGAAIERYQHAARLAGQLGRQVARAAALVNWAGLLVDVGAADEAAPVLDDAGAAAAAAGSALYTAQVDLVRAALVGRSSITEGRALAQQAREAFVVCEARRQALEARLLDAELAFAGGEPGPALDLLEGRGEDFARGGLGARALLLEARARLSRDELDVALRRAEAASALARDDGDEDLEARALSAAASVHGRLGTGAEQPMVLRARELFGRVAARLPAGLRERYLQDPVQLAMARAANPGGSAEPSSAELGLAPTRLLGLVRRLLLESRREERLLEAAVDQAVELVGAERAFLLRSARRRGGRPYVAVARNIRRESIRKGGGGARYSRSVAERVLETGEQVVTESAPDDPELRTARSILDLGLRSILCVPIRGPAGVAGALYLDHRFETGRFGLRQCELVQSLADIIGVALENARLRQEAEDTAGQLETANRALSEENERRAAEVERLGALLERSGGASGEAPGGMVGRSPALLRAIGVARRVAPSDLPVLVEGESGTGKELIARYVHDSSLRSAGPFMAINCGAVPESLLESELFGHVRGAFTGATRDHPGLFRAASGGTVLLDEIGEMTPAVQPRLLRVLQEGEVWPLGLDSPVSVDVRIVAATNRDLEHEVEAGRFRQDLFFRLVGVRVPLPPLRERIEDVPLLAETFLDRIAAEPGMSRLRLAPDATREILRHRWPGNVRELEQALRRGALLAEGEEIRAGDLGLSGERVSRREAIAGFDRDLVVRTLKATGGNRSAAARALGVSRSTLHRWIKRYGIT